ncbi:hypothetical protein HUG10_01175 [Halorarum halophilum]|uniref:Uncharacterized protein n=1 Tax=Halorarum halophilum TaxID=2743090 RepID=A0A7D5K5V0_9EURY|nr:hypothetical protein [Halobaculum halophilum]QLG26234.1 hypothetical protein HUG10_01175 [Halobaculum halophilum]
MEEDRERRLAELFAPDLYFGAAEAWYPTDPRNYESETDDGRTIVDGFDALDGYAREVTEADGLPAPIAFYHGRFYEGTDLGVIQFWFYSAFDQFSVNFHWHDWEVLHVFFDLESEEPELFVASSHSRKVPNNEFLDPDETRPAVISEVGSHSSALGMNQERDTFQRFPLGGDIADITNSVLDLIDIPAAYGLPRDEGFALPYAVPELDGTPVYDLPELPNVTAEHLVPAELTIDPFDEYDSPPTELPTRERGLHLRSENHPDADGADGTYALEHTDAVNHIEAFTGPQLSFQFAVPRFAEDAIAGHITTTGVPWHQPRFTNPAADVTDPIHRSALSDRYELDISGTLGDVVGVLREATTSDEAPGSNGIDTRSVRVEGVARLESVPEAVPTWHGVAAFRDVPEGGHRLTVNGAGLAPYAERLDHEEDGTPTAAGADGAVISPPNEDAVKVRAGAGSDGPSVADVTVEDDFAGAVYAGRPIVGEEGGFGTYVHRNGAFTAEITDEEGEAGAFRVNPDADQTTATVADLRTGKAALAGFVDTLLSETLVQTDSVAENGIDAIDDVPTPDDTVERGDEAAAAVDEAASRVEAATNGTVDDVRNGTGDGVPNGTDGDVVNGSTGPNCPSDGSATGDVLTAANDTGDDVLTSADGTTDDVLNGTVTDDGTTATPTETDDGLLDDVDDDGEEDPFRDESTTASPEDGDGTDDAGDGTGTEGGRNGGGNGPGSDLPPGFPGLLRALEASRRQASRAAEAAENGNAEAADRRLHGLRTRLSAILDVIHRDRGRFPETFPALVEKRVAQADRRIEQALDSSS